MKSQAAALPAAAVTNNDCDAGVFNNNVQVGGEDFYAPADASDDGVIPPVDAEILWKSNLNRDRAANVNADNTAVPSSGYNLLGPAVTIQK